MMKYFSAFTGVGGFDMGMPPDWECVGMSEVDRYANMVLRYRFKGVKNYGDIEKIKYEELPDFDILIGGSPCQDLSLAGKRAGLSGVRSRLFFSYVALLRAKQPHYFIFENVKGLLSSNEGRDFAEVINQFSESGYDIWWQVLDAADFGIPQHRERVFILGTLRGSGFRKIFFKREDQREDIEIGSTQIENLHFDRSQPNRIYGINGVAPTLHRKTGGNQVTKIGIPVRQADGRGENANGGRIKNLNEPSFTLQSSQRHGVAFWINDVNHGNEYDMGIRYLTPLECERLMGWPDNWTKYGIDEKGNMVELSDNQRYNLIGNGVVPQVVREIVRYLILQKNDVCDISDGEIDE